MIDFKTIKDNFDILEGMDRLQYLIDLSKKSKDISNELKTDKNKIYGYVSVSFLIVERMKPTINFNKYFNIIWEGVNEATGYYYDFGEFYGPEPVAGRGVILPGYEPSIFELKNPNQNIKGIVR